METKMENDAKEKMEDFKWLPFAKFTKKWSEKMNLGKGTVTIPDIECLIDEKTFESLEFSLQYHREDYKEWIPIFVDSAMGCVYYFNLYKPSPNHGKVLGMLSPTKRTPQFNIVADTLKQFLDTTFTSG
jgi:hypothetical protein